MSRNPQAGKHGVVLLESPDYKPEAFLEYLMRFLPPSRCTDAGLAEALDVHGAMISRIRLRQGGVSAEMLLRAYDMTGASVEELRALMGIKHPLVRRLERRR